MNHPEREDWAPYLFGETTPSVRRKMAEHLQHCPECAAEIAGWQRSLKSLDRWKLPPSRAGSSRRIEPLLKWAIAAALVLLAGYGLGRSSSPAGDDWISVRARMVASVRSSLNRDVQTALAATRNQITNGIQSQLNAAMAGVADATAAETRRQLNGYLQALMNAREEDRRAILASLEAIQKRHSDDYLSLRSDLETVASSTDEAIRRARQGLIQLASEKSDVRH